VLLLSILLAPLYGVACETNAQTIKEKTRPSLELGAVVVNQHYCKSSDGEGHDTLRMDLRLLYKNNGRQAVILYKSGGVVYRVMVSLNAQGAAERKYVFDLSLMAGVEGAISGTDGPVPGKDFVILSPGDTFETTANEGAVIFLKRTDEQKVNDALGSGDYTLQVSVTTFPYPQSLADSFRERWRSSGTLWSSDLTSMPTLFKIESRYHPVKCNPSDDGGPFPHN
jgi:hypothetical protein